MPTGTSDYRLTSILPVLFKIFEKIVLQQIINFLENNITYHQYRFGYRKYHSTLTVLPGLRNIIEKAMKGYVTIYKLFKKSFRYE